MNQGFLIRNDRCIGCHACTTACKSENDVPVGVNRTWVKNVEKGLYPDVRRTFQVTRCNHCANPPCVRICPVTAMYQRADGIVEFDPDRCIGCKACLQACPYDAIYIDPDSGTAAKCHFCAHRTDIGLEPACVVVCPEHAIISGDMDDPGSEISRMLVDFDVTVRKPEQGTSPKLFYVDGDEAALHPTVLEREPSGGFAWAEVEPLHDRTALGASAPSGSDRNDPSKAGTGSSSPTPHTSASGEPIRRPRAQGAPSGRPIHIGGGKMAGEMVRTFYNAQHRMPWHWPVPAYLVTKGIGAGLFMILALGTLMGVIPFVAGGAVAIGFFSLLFTGLTTALLVYDLERPERFLTILTRPQWSSWLTRGAVLLVGFTAVSGGWWVIELGAMTGWASPALAATVRPWALGTGGVLALGVAVYTAFLFGQAEGRDLWQSPLLPIHLLLQAILAGSAAILLFDPVLQLAPVWASLAGNLLIWTLVLDLMMIVFGELGMPHASSDAARAAHEIRSGRYARTYRIGVIFLGHLVPLGLLFTGLFMGLAPAGVTAAAGVLALVGLYLYEYAFVMAPQEIPNS